MMLHFTCGLMAGFTATCVGSPLDVIKTRLMNNTGEFSGVGDLIAKTLKNEGPGAFYNGFTANFMRIGFWNIFMWISLEKIKANFFA